MTSLVAVREKTYDCYGLNKHAENEAEEFFDTGFQLLGWEKDKDDEKKTLPPICLICLPPWAGQWTCILMYFTPF